MNQLHESTFCVSKVMAFIRHSSALTLKWAVTLVTIAVSKGEKKNITAICAVYRANNEQQKKNAIELIDKTMWARKKRGTIY